MEEMNVANHSDTMTETPTETTETSADTSTTTQAETAPQEQPKGFTVKYNKEDRFVSEDEAPTYIQKGLNYDKVAERAQQAEQYQQQLDRAARYHGFADHESYMKALERAEQEKAQNQEIERLAQLGFDEPLIREYLLPMQQQLQQTQQKLSEYETKDQQRQVEQQLQSEFEKLVNAYPDYNEYWDGIVQYASKYNMPLEEAYKLASHGPKLEKARREAEQEALARITGRDQKTVLPSKDQPNNVQYTPANMTFDQIDEISKRVQRGEKITFR